MKAATLRRSVKVLLGSHVRTFSAQNSLLTATELNSVFKQLNYKGSNLQVINSLSSVLLSQKNPFNVHENRVLAMGYLGWFRQQKGLAINEEL